MFKVLIVEDDQSLCKMLADFFLAAGYETFTSTNGDDGYEIFLQYSPDIILLDVVLPTIDGFSLCRKLRKSSSMPIIFVSGRTSVDDHLTGYNLKADDYITKPFNPEVLVAKVSVILDRIHQNNKVHTEQRNFNISYNGLLIKLKEHLVFADDQLIDLEPKQYQILCLLMKNTNITFSREQMLNLVWGFDYFGNSRIVDAQINKLRKRLMNKASMIQTVTGVGYKFFLMPPQ